MKKTQVFPDTPLVLVEWMDASGDDEDDANVTDPETLARFGSLMRSQVPGWLVRIDHKKGEAAIAHYKWPDHHRVGNSYCVPLALVKKIHDPVGGGVFYERARRRRRKPAAQAGA